MGKILGSFDIGWPGAISRSVDDVVVSLKNAGNVPIPFGAPVFLSSDGSGGVVGFIKSSEGTPQDFGSFVGFAVRSASKTPDSYPQGQDFMRLSGNQAGQWNPGEPVEVLVRGTIALKANGGFSAGGKVYIRKDNGKISPSAGSEGSTVWLENVRCRRPQEGNGECSEFVVTSRNIQ